jgi:hypothetical protein
VFQEGLFMRLIKGSLAGLVLAGILAVMPAAAFAREGGVSYYPWYGGYYDYPGYGYYPSYYGSGGYYRYYGGWRGGHGWRGSGWRGSGWHGHH